MTNYEHYKKQIEKIVRLGRRVAVGKDKKPCACSEINCDECIAGGHDCYQTVSKWADAEYIEPEVDWSKVPVDTPILVKQLRHNDWSRRYFSHYDNKNGLVCAFSDGKTSWTGQDDWKSWNYAKLAEVNDGI